MPGGSDGDQATRLNPAESVTGEPTPHSLGTDGSRHSVGQRRGSQRLETQTNQTEDVTESLPLDSYYNMVSVK
ncbi:hypothetical protein E4U21_000842 [Claviceps maximensis]|nr:hypothetical protein E4U21_000842 [Claviceps maximensis]